MFISVFKSEFPSQRLVVPSSCYSSDIKDDLAPIGYFVSTNQRRGSVWILQIFARGT